MVSRDLSKVYVSRAEEINDHGEYTKIWRFIPMSSKKIYASFNMQQDVNELDRKTSGEVDYSIYKARTQKKYNIQKGDGISLKDISKDENIVPDYRVMDINKIGTTYVYRLEKNNVQS